MKRNRKTIKQLLLSTLAVAGLTLAVGTTHAAPIFSENFESTGVADGAFTSDWDGPNGTPFTVTTLKGNLLNPTGTGSVWLNPVPPALGEIFAVLHSGGTATANTGQTFTAGQTYTLSFTHFRRDDLSGDPVQASIGDSSSALGSVDFDAVTSTDTFITREVVYTATAADDGKAIYLRFVETDGGNASEGQAGIDNIQLSVIPEPSSLALLGLGGLLLIGARRRRN